MSPEETTSEQTGPAELELLQRSVQGDREAFSVLVKRYWNSIFMLAYQKTFNRQDAEEIAQDAFLRAYKNIGTLRNRHAFAGWIYKIAMQICIDYARRRDRFKKALPSIQAEAEQKTAAPDDSADRKELSRKILAAVKELSDPDRLIVTLVYLEGCTCRQIAERLGELENTIRVRLHRAVKTLRERLGEALCP